MILLSVIQWVNATQKNRKLYEEAKKTAKKGVFLRKDTLDHKSVYINTPTYKRVVAIFISLIKALLMQVIQFRSPMWVNR